MMRVELAVGLGVAVDARVRADVGDVEVAGDQGVDRLGAGVEVGGLEGDVVRQVLLEEALLHADERRGVGQVREVAEVEGDRLLRGCGRSGRRPRSWPWPRRRRRRRRPRAGGERQGQQAGQEAAAGGAGRDHGSSKAAMQVGNSDLQGQICEDQWVRRQAELMRPGPASGELAPPEPAAVGDGVAGGLPAGAGEEGGGRALAGGGDEADVAARGSRPRTRRRRAACARSPGPGGRRRRRGRRRSPPTRSTSPTPRRRPARRCGP